MKLRRSMFRFLVLSVFVAGAFSALSVAEVKAQPGGTFCQSTYNWCLDDCAVPLNLVINNQSSTQAEVDAAWKAYWKCNSKCGSTQLACFSENAWQSWLQQFDYNITDDFFLIQNGPDPICAMFPQMIMDCGNLESAEDIEACVMMIQQEQAKYRCP
jgi:hypothetical protein